MKKIKRTACMLLTVVMVLSLCPFAAFADEETETPVTVTETINVGASQAAVPAEPAAEASQPEASSTQTETQTQTEEPATTVEQHVHNYVLVSRTAPTCSAKGYELYRCECGAQYVSDLPVIPGAHYYGDNNELSACKYCGQAKPVETVAAAEAAEEEEETVESSAEEAIAALSETDEEESEEDTEASAPMLFSASPMLASGSSTSSITYSFNQSSGELTVTGSTGNERLEGKDSEFSSDKTDIESALALSGDSPSSVLAVIVNKIKEIGKFAFTGLKNLQAVFIGEDTKEIESGAFAGTTELDAIIVDSDNENYADEFGVLYTKDKTELVAVPADKDGAIVVNPNVTTVDDYAFAYSDLSDAYFLGNAPTFESADGTVKHTFEGTGTTIRHACWNWSWYNPSWVYDTFIDTPMVATWTSIRAYHYPVVTKSGVKPTETEFGLTDELHCRVCGALVQAQTKIWPNGKDDTGTYSFNSITSVPSSLANNEKYNTVEKIKDALKTETAAEYKNKTDKTMPEINYKAYDIKLVSGPQNGPYVVTIPYPAGVGPEHYDFVCVQLNTNGNMEKLDVFETNRGLQVTVSDLSPIGFAWYYNDVDP